MNQNINGHTHTSQYWEEWKSSPGAHSTYDHVFSSATIIVECVIVVDVC